MNAFNLIDKGVYFEDRDIFLPWNCRQSDLIETGNPDVSDSGDRIIYTWKHARFLNGLVLDWYAHFWKDGIERRFQQIENLAVGDEIAPVRFELIANHLSNTIGVPIKKDDRSDYDKSWVWSINGVRITLYLFEMHSYRCAFSVMAPGITDEDLL